MIMTAGNLGTTYPGETSGLDKPYLYFGELLGPSTNVSRSLALAHYLLCAAIWNLPVPGSFEIPALKSTSSSWALWCLLLGTCPCNNSYLLICPTPHSVSSGHSWPAEGSPLCPPSSLFLLICSGCLEVFLGA